MKKGFLIYAFNDFLTAKKTLITARIHLDFLFFLPLEHRDHILNPNFLIFEFRKLGKATKK